MRFSEAKGRKVVSTSTAATVGKVHGFAVDPAQRRVVALGVAKTEGDADAVLWSALTAVGRDAVTVPAPDALTVAEGQVADLLGKKLDVMKKRVLTENGDDVGQVTDVEFDAASGQITAILTKTEEIDGSRLAGVGSYAVVVRRAT